MSSGGARNRSGPKKQEGSGRAERAGYKLTALPAEGYDGPVPDFPLADPTERELEVWADAWRTPQACGWAVQSEAWRTRNVAMWTRISVRCEAPDAPATLIGQLHRYDDKVGFSTAGLAEMGWKVAVDELAARRQSEQPEEEKPKQARRLRPTATDDASGD